VATAEVINHLGLEPYCFSEMSKKRPFLGKINLSALPDSERIIPTGSNENMLEPSSELVLSKDFSLADLEIILELGAGNGGTVYKVKKDAVFMALKKIQVDANASVQKQILRELQILKNCNSPFIVGYYGAFLEEGEISVCMEYMDCGALDSILKRFQRLPLEIVGKISFAVLSGLVYLFETHRIIHRGIFFLFYTRCET
jgi:mitogen-activated protein kinase kinase